MKSRRRKHKDLQLKSWLRRCSPTDHDEELRLRVISNWSLNKYRLSIMKIKPIVCKVIQWFLSIFNRFGFEETKQWTKWLLEIPIVSIRPKIEWVITPYYAILYCTFTTVLNHYFNFTMLYDIRFGLFWLCRVSDRLTIIKNCHFLSNICH